jgi:hypothetical protein
MQLKQTRRFLIHKAPFFGSQRIFPAGMHGSFVCAIAAAEMRVRRGFACHQARGPACHAAWRDRHDVAPGLQPVCARGTRKRACHAFSPAYLGCRMRPMKNELLTAMLEGQKGVRKDGNAFVLDETISATFFVGGSIEAMSVARVVRVEVAKEICALTTTKRERFLFPVEALLGLKLEESSEHMKPPGSAGFR